MFSSHRRETGTRIRVVLVGEVDTKKFARALATDALVADEQRVPQTYSEDMLYPFGEVVCSQS
jgi:hypothetical protein